MTARRSQTLLAAFEVVVINPFGVVSPQLPWYERIERWSASELSARLKQRIDPSSWDSAGGRGKIAASGSVLTITQTATIFAPHPSDAPHAER